VVREFGRGRGPGDSAGGLTGGLEYRGAFITPSARPSTPDGPPPPKFVLAGPGLTATTVTPEPWMRRASSVVNRTFPSLEAR
jgi:hypothetical protein